MGRVPTVDEVNAYLGITSAASSSGWSIGCWATNMPTSTAPLVDSVGQLAGRSHGRDGPEVAGEPAGHAGLSSRFAEVQQALRQDGDVS